jgi:S-formylglutathione hydrolase FrmB
MEHMLKILTVCCLVSVLGCGANEPTGLRFDITLGTEVAEGPARGRVYVVLSPGPESEPLFSAPHHQIVFACDATDRNAAGSWSVDSSSDGYPGPLSTLAPGEYSIRAVLDRDTVDWKTGWAPGNIYSSKTTRHLDHSTPETIDLVLEHRIEPEAFTATARIREVRLQSDLVSNFAGAPRFLEAAVVLPENYDGGSDTYPTVYVMPGWGASHHIILQGQHQQRRYGMDGFGREKIYVFLNHDMRYGAHCFANSDVVGPWGDALVRELVPYIEREYRVIPDAGARFLTGQSSGGWGVLWLQMTYPKEFGSVFAASPDFVDFRSFGPGLDLYAEGANFFTGPDGQPRPGVRDPRNGRVLMTVQEAAVRQSVVLGADQLTSFEAVFGRPAKDGRPRQLVDRQNGAIDRGEIPHWARYDLARVLADRWGEIGPDLRGKIHIWVGGNDDYYLDQPVRLLQQQLFDLGADAHVEVIPGLGHDVWSDEIRSFIHERIDALTQR